MTDFEGPKTGDDETLRAVIRTMDSSSDAVLICTADLDLPGPRILYVNPAFMEMTGYRTEEVVEQTPRMFQGPGTSRAELDRMRQALSGQRDFNGHIINYRKERRTLRGGMAYRPASGSCRVDHTLGLDSAGRHLRRTIG